MNTQQNPETADADNIDGDEIRKFSDMAQHWWDRNGDLKALHDINPVRLAYIRDRAGIAGKCVVDVGCGGGLLSEALAAAGGCVTGIDMAAKALRIAAAHARRNGLEIEYRKLSAERFAAVRSGHYDIVTCMELLEHVPDPEALVAACGRLAKPGADLFFATVNRNLPARLLVIWAAERVFGIVRKGTHRYDRFIRPTELAGWGRAAGLTVMDVRGVRYIPFVGIAGLCGSTVLNYMIHFRKRPGQAP